MKKQTTVGLILNICLENSVNVFYCFEMTYRGVIQMRKEEELYVEIYRRRRLWFKLLSFIFGWFIPFPENNFGSPKMVLKFLGEDNKTPFVDFYMEKKFFGKIESFNDEITIDDGEVLGNFHENVEPHIFNPVFYSERAFSEIMESLKQRGFKLLKKEPYVDDID